MAVAEAPYSAPFRIEGYPAPQPGRVELFGFARAMGRHLKNKEDTTLVFEIMRTLLGRSHVRGFTRFLRTPMGQKVLADERNLIDVLRNRNALAQMPAGSFGRAYYDFFIREGLMIDLLVDASAELDRKADQDPNKYPDFMRYVHRMRYCHDLWHVLLGYGRDGVGEACNVAFSYSQTKIRGFAAIAWMAGTKFQFQAKGYPVWRAVLEAFRIGREAKWFLGEDIEALLRRPLDDVRAQLNIASPEIYLSIPAEVLERVGKPEERGRATGAQEEAA